MGVPLETSGSLNVVTITVQVASAQAASDIANAGVCSFDENMFTVDANGFVTASGTTAIQFDADTGSATPALGIVNVLGDAAQGLVTSAAGNTITYTNSDATETQKGVSELATDAEAIAGADTSRTIVASSLAAKLGVQTQFGVAIGNTPSGALNWTSAGTDGQLIIAATGADPAFADLTSTGGTITVTPGVNTLNIDTDGSVAAQYDTDAGSAVPAAGVLDILGGTLLNTAGATSVVTINADDNVVGSVATDSGTVTPTSNSFTIAGGNGCTTSGSGATVTIDVTGGGLVWNETTVTGPTTLDNNNGYIANNAVSVVGFTLPATAALGDVIRISGKGAGGWSLGQNAGQTIHFGTSSTTPGAGGSLASTETRDSIEMVCVTANTDFNVLSSIGNITVV